MSRWVIVGCGYAGERIAAQLKERDNAVVVTTRRAERAKELEQRLGVVVCVADPLQPESLGESLAGADVIVDSVPPTIGSSPHQAGLVEKAAAAGGKRIVYLCSTGVYPLGDGSWVDEDTPVGPASERGKARVAAEDALFKAAAAHNIEAVSLRIAAIYGPGRGVEARLCAGTYRVVGDGKNWVCRIHVDDLARVAIAAGTKSPLVRNAYVVADDEPTTSRAYADAVANKLGLPPPPTVAPEDIDPAVRDLVKTNRRINNARIKSELGVVLHHPRALS